MSATLRSCLRACLPTVASVLVLIAATLARPADGRTSSLGQHGYRELFREAMRHRDLGKWQEALILFDAARKQNGVEGERVRFYGRKRFPHYVPRFYVGEALFQLGDYAKAFETWRAYEPGGKYVGVLPDEQRDEIAGYRWLYEQRIYPELFKSLAQRMLAARGSLAALQEAKQSLGKERWRELEARALKLEPSCTAPATGASSDTLQELRSCLDAAELLLDKAGRGGDYARIQEASRLLEALTPTIVEAEGQVGRSRAVTLPAGTGGVATRAPDELPDFRPTAPPASGDGGPFYARRYALVIGIWAYTKHPWKRLAYVESDVDEVSAALRRVGYEVEPLLNPTKEILEKTLRRFLQTKGGHPQNQVLVYYAGHGGHAEVVKGGIENAFFIPVDAGAGSEKEPWYYSAVPLLTLVNEIQAVPAEHVLAVLDSCFSGDVFRYSFRQPEGRPSSAGRGASRGLSVADGSSSETGRRRTGDDWADEWLSRPARWYLTAGRADEEVPDKSRFREAFVKALRGFAPSQRPRVLTIEELTSFVKSQLTGSKQKPIGRHIGIDSQNEGQILFQLPGATARASAQAIWAEPLRRVQLAFVARDEARP